MTICKGVSGEGRELTNEFGWVRICNHMVDYDEWRKMYCVDQNFQFNFSKLKIVSRII